MNIAIVILNWNGEELLEKFLPSVVNNSKQASIYVADNASSDDSIMFVKTNYPEIHIIQNKTNAGFAKGYNEALKTIDADMYCLLNNDVEVSENWLRPIVNTFEEEKNTAIIQPKIRDYKNKLFFEYAGAAGGYIDKYGYPYCRGRLFNTLEKDHGQYDDKVEIFWASGACLFIRASVFKKLKGFDTHFFAHMEEIDLCWRAKNLGYSVRYVGDSKVYHVGGATLNQLNPKKTYLNFRNSLFALTKNASGYLFPLVFVRLILDGLAAGLFLFERKPKHTMAVFKAHMHFYYHLKRLLKQRRFIKPTIKYYQKPSVVIDYFVKGKKDYKNL